MIDLAGQGGHDPDQEGAAGCCEAVQRLQQHTNRLQPSQAQEAQASFSLKINVKVTEKSYSAFLR
jgi:hypothetical protein